MKSRASAPRLVLPISPLARPALLFQDLKIRNSPAWEPQRRHLRVRGRFWSRERRSKLFLIRAGYLTITRHVKQELQSPSGCFPKSSKSGQIWQCYWLRTRGKFRDLSGMLWLQLHAVPPCRWFSTAAFSRMQWPMLLPHSGIESQCRATFNDIADLPGFPVKTCCFVRPVVV